MFGCCVAGRPLQTNLTQVDETHAFFELPAASLINHLCVFLLGPVPFPDGYGATVHFYWPGKGFQLLGMLSNEKPSAIFRLRGTYTTATNLGGPHAMFASQGQETAEDITAILGISIEPLPSILTQLAALPSAVGPPAASVPDATKLAERIVKHLFNYLSGFVQGGTSITPETLVPIGVIARWYDAFISKARNTGLDFLERQE